MNPLKKCSRCHEYYTQKRRSRYGQICPWCEENMIMAERELSRKCGLHPLSEADITYLNKYWRYRKA